MAVIVLLKGWRGKSLTMLVPESYYEKQMVLCFSLLALSHSDEMPD
jgi:hypothetical protein